jgi:predicted dehydrogenase
MSEPPTRVAIVGCGNIAGPYARDLVTYPDLVLAGMTDLDVSRAEALAEKYGGRVYPGLDALLADASVEVVVNLTTHHAHAGVTTACLEAGKHVWSEKPLALTHAEAQGLVALATRQGQRLGCAPFTWLGEAQQTAAQWLRAGKLGTVRAVLAEVNWGRIERWHPAPQAFYEVGPLYDVGVYPLMLLTAFFGPATRVTAFGRVLWPERRTKSGERFRVETPDFVVALIEFGEQLVTRLSVNFYVTQATHQQGIEFHGDDGSLHLGSWLIPEASLRYGAFGQPLEAVPLAREPGPGVRWGLGIHEMVAAIRAGQPHRVTGEHAAHVVEILEAAATSVQRQVSIPLHSSFPPPALMPWASLT